MPITPVKGTLAVDTVGPPTQGKPPVPVAGMGVGVPEPGYVCALTCQLNVERINADKIKNVIFLIN